MNPIGEERMVADHGDEGGRSRLSQLVAEPLFLRLGVFPAHGEAPREWVLLGAGQVGVEADEGDDGIFFRPGEGVPAVRHGPAGLDVFGVGELELDLAVDAVFVVVIAEHGVERALEVRGWVHLLEVPLPAWAVQTAEHVAVPVVAEKKHGRGVDMLAVHVLLHLVGDGALLLRVAIRAPVAEHQHVRVGWIGSRGVFAEGLGKECTGPEGG